MFATSSGSVLGAAANQASRISCSSASDVARRLSASTFASFHLRAPSAVGASPHSAARTPSTLLAAIDAPVPVQQQTTAWSARPSATSRAAASEAHAQSSRSASSSAPCVTTSWPRLRSSSTTASAIPTRSSAATEMRMGSMMQQGLEAALHGLLGFVPGESDDPPAIRLERGVAAAVGFEGGPRPVGLPAVELDDEPVGRPAEVDLEAWVVGGGEGEVDQWLWQGCVADELKEPGLELVAGPLRLVARDRLGQRSGSSVPVRSGDEVGDGAVVVELQPLGLRKRALELAAAHGRRQVQQRARDGR